MLENILKGIKNISLKVAPYMLFGAAAIPAVVGLGGGCDDRPKNRAPVIQTISIPDAQENQDYNTQILATDKENESLTYSMKDGPSWITIDANNGSVTGKPYDGDVIQNESITVEVSDTHLNTDEKTFYFDIKNVSTANGIISDFDSNNLNNTLIEFLQNSSVTNSTNTNSFGEYTIENVLDGNYQLKISNSGFVTYEPRTLIVNKTKDLAGKLENDFKLVDDAFKDFAHEGMRTPFDVEHRIVKLPYCYEFNIYTKEKSIGNDVPQAKIDIVKDIINNELYKMDPLIQSPTINEINSIPPAGFINTIFKVGWSDGLGGKGVNNVEIINDDINAGYAYCKTSEGKDTWIAELTSMIYGRAESNKKSSVFNDPSTVSDYTTNDFKLSEIHQSRTAGNTYTSATNTEKNPVGTLINE